MASTYQGTRTGLLHDVEQDQDEDGEVMDSNAQVGQELREQVAKVLGCDPKDVAPRRQG